MKVKRLVISEKHETSEYLKELVDKIWKPDGKGKNVLGKHWGDWILWDRVNYGIFCRIRKTFIRIHIEKISWKLSASKVRPMRMDNRGSLRPDNFELDAIEFGISTSGMHYLFVCYCFHRCFLKNYYIFHPWIQELIYWLKVAKGRWTQQGLVLSWLSPKGFPKQIALDQKAATLPWGKVGPHEWGLLRVSWLPPAGRADIPFWGLTRGSSTQSLCYCSKKTLRILLSRTNHCDGLSSI